MNPMTHQNSSPKTHNQTQKEKEEPQQPSSESEELQYLNDHNDGC